MIIKRPPSCKVIQFKNRFILQNLIIYLRFIKEMRTFIANVNVLFIVINIVSNSAYVLA